MKAKKECFECLQGLADQVIRLATGDRELRRRLRIAMEDIFERFSTNVVPTDISNEIHHTAKVISANIDPYRELKLREIEVSKKIFSTLKVEGGLRRRVEVAALGNAIDYFVSWKQLKEDLAQPPEFAIDDVEQLRAKLRKARRILYLPDNVGEVFFDLPLLGYLSERVDVFYAVKTEPVQNDLSMDDLELLDGVKLPVTIIKGPPTVGVYLLQAPVEFRMAFDVADFVISKGMANYETLSELPQNGRFFYILRAKCKPVAKSLGVGVGDYVAALR